MAGSKKPGPRHARVSKRAGGRRSVAGVIGDVLLTLLAIFGVICAAAAVAAWALGVNIMIFRTGSMEPGIPVGAVALVREIPAAEAEVGDVITVKRGEGQMPITHRVISNEPDPDYPPNGRIIEMQGDANPAPDPLPYHVEEVSRLFWSQPDLGKLVVRLGHPAVLGSVTVLAAFLVGWAFWPRDQQKE